jgi:hypothetical protein
MLGGRITAITESYSELLEIASKYEDLNFREEDSETMKVVQDEIATAAHELIDACSLLISRLNGEC